MVRASASEAAAKISSVHDDMVQHFTSAAQTVLDSIEGKDDEPEEKAVEAIARCLAVIAGYTEALEARSLVTGSEGFQTCLFTPAGGLPIQSMSFVWNGLKRELPSEMVEEFKSMTITADSKQGVFDVPTKHLKAVKAVIAKNKDSCIALATSMPALKAAPAPERQSYGGGGGGYGGGGRGGGGFGGGRGGGRGGGFGGGRGGGRGGGGWRGGR